MKNIFILLALIGSLGSTTLTGQSISLFDIDTSAFPMMKAKFYAFDASGNQVSPTTKDLVLKENGIVRNVTNISCPPPSPRRVLSSVLVIDISGSMGREFNSETNMSLARTAAVTWVNELLLEKGQCAVTSFNDANYLNQDFTTDKGKLIAAINRLQPQGGTDYNVALLEPMAGGLVVSKNGTYQRVIVFLTDGESVREPDVNSIVAEAKKQNCTIFCVTLRMPAPKSVKDIAQQTGGQVFEYVSTQQEAKEAYIKILRLVQNDEPCVIEWQSNVRCVNGANATVELQLLPQGLTTQRSYRVSNSSLGYLEYAPSSMRFENPPIGTEATQTMKITSRGSLFNVSNITSTNPAFTVSPTSFTLKANQSQDITIRYTAVESGFTYTRLVITSDVCEQTYFVSGGYKGKRPKVKTLKLTRPNGGQTFVVGSDTVITWEGIPSTDLVRLEYSTNRGANWRYIDTARGLSYIWKKIPRPVSQTCLVRVSQLVDTTNTPTDTVRTLRGHTNSVNSVAFSPDGNTLASGSVDATIKLWNVNTGLEILSLTGHTYHVNSVAFSSDGRTLASASSDRTIKLWDAFTGQLINTLSGHSNNVYTVAFSNDGSVIASGGDDGTIKTWDVKTGKLIRSWAGHFTFVNRIIISPNGGTLASIGADETIKLWDISSGQLINTLTGVANRISNIAFSPSGRNIVSINNDSTITLWNVSTGKSLYTIKGNNNFALGLAYSPDDSTIATGNFDNTVKLWNLSNGQLLRTLNGHTNQVRSVAYSPDGNIVASGSDDKTIRLWDVYVGPLQDDQSDAVFSIVEPRASSRDIVMGQVLLGTNKDSTVVDFLRNSNWYPFNVKSISFRGADAGAFRLVSGIPEYRVAPTSSAFGEFRFAPNRVGLHQAEVVIVVESDTIIQRISGEGVTPVLAVVNPLIDFGVVEVGKWRDTLRAVTIRNIGISPLTIKATQHGTPNDVDFSTLTGGGSFTLAVGDTARLDLRFTAREVGRTSGRLLFEYDGVGSPAMVQLFAQGVRLGPQITTLGANIFSVTCVAEKVDTVKVKNVGSDTLKIASATFVGVNQTEFQLATSFAPSIVLPDSTLLLAVKYSPISFGTHSATLEVRSNSITDSILTLPLSGRKENTDFSASVQRIDIGILCPNEVKDTSITLTNSGTISNTYRMQATNPALASSSVTISGGDNKTLVIKYGGSPSEGIINETITLTDTICGIQKTIQFIGRIESPKIKAQVLADFGTVASGASTTREVYAVNTDSRPMTVALPQGITSPFTLVGMNPVTGSVLLPNDTVKAIIRCDGQSGGVSTGVVRWMIAQPCMKIDSTELRTQGINPDTARTTIAVENITAQAGERVSLNLVLKKQSGMQLAGAPREWSAQLHYNGTILYNEGGESCGGRMDSCSLQLNGTYNPNKSELLSLPMRVTLGNTDNSEIVIDEFRWTNSGITSEVVTQNGQVRVTGLCEEGGVRLVIPTGAKTSLACRPNPAKDEVRIEYGIIEPLVVTIEIINLQGQVVATPVRGVQQVRGMYSVPADISTLSSGVYYVRMTTSSGVLTSRMDVVK
jgi:WD40 repeat protein